MKVPPVQSIVQNKGTFTCKYIIKNDTRIILRPPLCCIFLKISSRVDPWTPPAFGLLDPLLITVWYIFPVKHKEPCAKRKIDTVHIASQSMEIVFEIWSKYIYVHWNQWDLKSYRCISCALRNGVFRNIPMNECFVVGLGIPPTPGDKIHTPVDLITGKLCTYIICFCIWK
jgi:hypothetical protein